MEKQYVVTHNTPINVQLIRRNPGELFKAKEDSEMKTLVMRDYVREI